MSFFKTKRLWASWLHLRREAKRLLYRLKALVRFCISISSSGKEKNYMDKTIIFIKIFQQKFYDEIHMKF